MSDFHIFVADDLDEWAASQGLVRLLQVTKNLGVDYEIIRGGTVTDLKDADFDIKDGLLVAIKLKKKLTLEQRVKNISSGINRLQQTLVTSCLPKENN